MKKHLLFTNSPKISITISAVFVVSLLLSWYSFAKGGLLWIDFEGQWLICRHIIEGINPYLHTECNPFHVEDLSPVPVDYGTSPWGCITGMLFYPGFLSYGAARIWFVVFAALLYVTVAVYAYSKAAADNQKYVVILSLLGTVAYWYSVRFGNAGSIMCILLMFAVMLKDGHRFLAGVCLAVALVKPQVSLLICLYLLLDKKYITLFVAASINILAYACIAVILKTGPVELLRQFFACNIGGQDMYHGIMSMLSPALFDYNTAMYASMLVGTLYAVVMYYFMKRSKNITDWRLSLPFFLASAFWSYSSWGNEYLIMLPLCLMYEPDCFPKDMFKQLLLAALIYICVFANPILWCLVPVIEPDNLIPTTMFITITIIFTYLTISANAYLHYTKS
ncbi:MAG: glycosyltransferase 87 family protein [Prevotella sp.]